MTLNTRPCVFIVDDDDAVRDSLGLVMETAGLACQTFESAEHFLATYCPGTPGCLLLDINMPDMSGDELQTELIRRGICLPIIFLTAHGDIPMTVRAIKAGAVDFLTKPATSKLLIERVQAALLHEAQTHEQATMKHALSKRLNDLTAREFQVMSQVLAGHSNKEIARHLGISYRTVEIHRIRVLKKTGAANLLELARIWEASGHPTKTIP